MEKEDAKWRADGAQGLTESNNRLPIRAGLSK